MTQFKPNLFLLMVAMFSFYLAFSGYRSLYHKRPRDRAGMLDWSGLGLMAAGSIGLLAWGVIKLRTGTDLGWVAIVFGLLSSVVATNDVHKFLVPATDRRAWLYRHMTGMLGAYIATVSAFSVVNFHFLPPLLRWLWPTALGVPTIVMWIAGYKRSARPTASNNLNAYVRQIDPNT